MEMIVNASIHGESSSLMKILINLGVDKDIAASHHSVGSAVPGMCTLS